MAAKTYPLELEQGATYDLTLEWREDNDTDPPTGPLVDTSDYDAFITIRDYDGATMATLDSISSGGGILVANGLVVIRISALITATIVKPGTYLCELRNRTDDTDVVRLVSGPVTLAPDVPSE